ncbi:hypothetical protein WMY93_020902 [Mugilogobius chulae]|uniref:Uncharacterized protein n=1 Tax=Mugilogobius chulae TaxID=88201 RepID=A0AAW0NJR1_9GOBI
MERSHFRLSLSWVEQELGQPRALGKRAQMMRGEWLTVRAAAVTLCSHTRAPHTCIKLTAAGGGITHKSTADHDTDWDTLRPGGALTRYDLVRTGLDPV